MDIIGILVEGDIVATVVNMFTVAITLDFVGSLAFVLKGGRS